MNRGELRRMKRQLGWRGAKAKRKGTANPFIVQALNDAVRERLEREKEVQDRGSSQPDLQLQS